MAKQYTDEHGNHHIESNGVNDPTIVWRWRIVSDASPWKQPKGKELRWMMSDDQAAVWQAKNPGTVIEKIEGSDEARFPLKGWGSPHSRGGLGE